MVKNIQKVSNAEVLLEEEIDINIVTALMRNYRNPVEAILELVDNALDDRRENMCLNINIYLGKNLLTIVDIGGNGMGLEELKGFLKWGRSSKRGKLGRYGQGGKAAMGYLGNSWKIQSSKLGEKETYIIEEYDWRDRSNGKKKYRPLVIKDPTPNQGRAEITIRDLSRKINEKKLKEALSDYYRMLLEEKKIQIKINKEILDPLLIPLSEKEEFTEAIGDSKQFHGWIGLLIPNAGLKGGIRCCVMGRKITENEYFGQPDYMWKASLNRLSGEINADFLELNLNKTGFDTDSWGWQKVQEKMFIRMQPYVDFLLGEKEEEQITEDEKKRHKEASKIWNDFMKEYLKEGKLPIEGLRKREFDRGQKPLEERGTIEEMEEIITPRGKYEPATPPPEIAIGKRKRLKRFLGIEAQPGIIPDINTRSEIQTKNKKEVIIVNKKFPVYKKRKGDTIYIWETIAMECAKPEKDEEMDWKEYVKEVNKILSTFCIYLEKQKIKL